MCKNYDNNNKCKTKTKIKIFTKISIYYLKIDIKKNIQQILRVGT